MEKLYEFELYNDSKFLLTISDIDEDSSLINTLESCCTESFFPKSVLKTDFKKGWGYKYSVEVDFWSAESVNRLLLFRFNYKPRNMIEMKIA